MSIRLSRGCWAVVLAVAGSWLCLPGNAQAHPQLAGQWIAAAPPGSFTSYQFGVGEYIGNGIWRGPFTFYWSNYPVVSGKYELRIYGGTQATLGLQEGCNTGTRVGNIDLGARVLTFMGVTYRP
jgi:hypothetical protein